MPNNAHLIGQKCYCGERKKTVCRSIQVDLNGNACAKYHRTSIHTQAHASNWHHVCVYIYWKRNGNYSVTKLYVCR